MPAGVAKDLIDGESHRIIFSINGSPESQRALLPRGDGSYVVTVNKKLRTALRLESGARLEVTMRSDRSKYGLPMPEELEELLRQDREGDRIFHALTPGKMRTLLYLVGTAKHPGQRLFRANTVVNHLKIRNGNLNFRQLLNALKRR